MEDVCGAPGGLSAAAPSVGAAAGLLQHLSAVAPLDIQQQINGPASTSSVPAAGTTAAPAPSCAPAVGPYTASLEAIAAACATAAGTAAPHQFPHSSNFAAVPAGEPGPPPPPGTSAEQPASYPTAVNPSMWSNFAAAAADPGFFSRLSHLMTQHQQRQQPGFSINPINTDCHTNTDDTAAPAGPTGTATNTTTPAGHFYNPDSQQAGSLPGSPSFPHSTLPGSLSNAAAAAAAAFSNASLGTSTCSEAGDKTCSHCGKVEQRQWRKRGDGTLLCNRCFMWRRNHGGVELPPLDPAPMQPAIFKQHSLGVRASSSGGSSSHSRHARHSSPGMSRALQDLAGLQEAHQQMSHHGSRHGSGSYSAPSSPARPRSRSGSATSSPARRRRAGSPDDPEYRPRGNSKLSRSTSHASDNLSAVAAATGAAARSSASGHNMQQQRSKLRPRSRLARAGGSGAWEDEEEADMGNPSDSSAGGRQLQHQGSSGRSRLAAAAAVAAAAESDEEVVSAAEVLAELLPMGCYEAVDTGAEPQEAPVCNDIDAAAATAAPPPACPAAHQGEVLRFPAHQQSIKAATGNIKARDAAELRRSGPGSLAGSCKGNGANWAGSAAGNFGKGSSTAGSMGTGDNPSLKNSTATAVAAGTGALQQHGGFSEGHSWSPAAAANAEQAEAAVAAGTINPHVYRAILTALAAGAPAESIDLVSTQRKFEVMEQQLHVPHSPAAAHLLSRMSGMSP